MATYDHEISEFDQAAEEAVALGNRLLQQDEDADNWDVASGLLAGAVQFWLFARQPCGDPNCESCSEVDTAEKRLRKMLEEINEFAEESDYYHTQNDVNVGRA
ncbi:MAG: hypothetical protein ACE10E_04985 [Acidiferrobacterales bacterium]|jgi:hypothetical protein|nr:hypothetical protein [Nitrospira sp.]MCZ6577258.1 hypothetical protein [Gammaproteobacteria bacterium]